MEWVPSERSFSPESICTGTTSCEVRVATTITSSMLKVVSEAQFFSSDMAVESRSWAEAAKRPLTAVSITATASA